jgi:glutamine synthetase type III
LLSVSTRRFDAVDTNAPSNTGPSIIVNIEISSHDLEDLRQHIDVDDKVIRVLKEIVQNCATVVVGGGERKASFLKLC